MAGEPSHASRVLTELLAELRAAHASYDLSTVSGTHHVMLADSGLPQVDPPYVLLSAPVLDVSYESTMSEYAVVGTIDWFGYAAPPGADLEQRVTAGLDLARDVVAAVQAGHANPLRETLYTLAQLLPRRVEVFGDGPEVPPGLVVVVGQIVYRTDLSRGV